MSSSSGGSGDLLDHAGLFPKGQTVCTGRLYRPEGCDAYNRCSSVTCTKFTDSAFLSLAPKQRQSQLPKPQSSQYKMAETFAYLQYPQRTVILHEVPIQQ